MGIKEYIAKKAQQKNVPKHSVFAIDFCYTQDGSFIAPYAYNGGRTTITDLQTNKTIAINNISKDSQENELNALSQLYGIDAKQITHDNIPFMLKCFTYGYDVPGRVFQDIRLALLVEDFATWYERNLIIDEHLHDTLIQTANYEDLKSFTKLLAKNIAKENKRNQKVEKDLQENSK